MNIHPSLLPKYGGKGMYGMRVHQAVIDSGDVESGATVHLVTEEYDVGRILGRLRAKRFQDDTAESLAGRVLDVEHILYTQVLRDIRGGVIKLSE